MIIFRQRLLEERNVKNDEKDWNIANLQVRCFGSIVAEGYIGLAKIQAG